MIVENIVDSLEGYVDSYLKMSVTVSNPHMVSLPSLESRFVDHSICFYEENILKYMDSDLDKDHVPAILLGEKAVLTFRLAKLISHLSKLSVAFQQISEKDFALISKNESTAHKSDVLHVLKSIQESSLASCPHLLLDLFPIEDVNYEGVVGLMIDFLTEIIAISIAENPNLSFNLLIDSLLPVRLETSVSYVSRSPQWSNYSTFYHELVKRRRKDLKKIARMKELKEAYPFGIFEQNIISCFRAIFQLYVRNDDCNVEGSDLNVSADNESRESFADPNDIILALNSNYFRCLVDEKVVESLKQPRSNKYSNWENANVDDDKEHKQGPSIMQRHPDAVRLEWDNCSSRSSVDSDNREHHSELATEAITSSKAILSLNHDKDESILIKRRHKCPWTARELTLLEQGMLKHGRSWTKILQEYGHGPEGFAEGRTTVDLKDKARNETLRRRKKGMDGGIFGVAVRV